ncbi:MAG: CotH kinase family protein [Bacteroidota bacterium]
MKWSCPAILLIALSLSLSGQETIRDTISFDAPAPKGTGAYIIETTVDTAYTLVINEILASNSGSLFDSAGDDDDWFELHNFGDEPVRLNGLCFTDDIAEPCKWRLDDSEVQFLGAGEFIIIWADGEPEEGYNHAPFKLSSDGEYLGIYLGDGTLVHQLTFGPQSTNISYGQFPDAGSSWNFFYTPTPGEPNLTPGAGTVLPLVVSNLKGGFFSEPVELILHSSVEDASIMYTINCTNPNISSMRYLEPIGIDSTTIIKARLIKGNAIDGPVLTISIIMDDTPYENPVISMVADPDALYGTTGLISANNRNVEVSANLEYFEGGKSLYSGGTGIQLHSPKSWMPNSLRLYARSMYGNSWFEYPFFEEKGPVKFKRMILRNSGNDNVNKATTNTHFRDPLIQTIARTTNEQPMISESRPVTVYLNGEYHGLFNLRERIDEHYITTRTGVEGDFDLLERAFGYPLNENAITGSFSQWKDLLSFAENTGDLSLDEDFEYVRQQVDLDNFTDYWITEVFAGNYDWLSNNTKFWKSESGKWQWIYWDTDHGIGLIYDVFGEVSWNTLNWSLTFSDRAWPTGYNNILIRNLLKNDGYRDRFIKRFSHMLNTSFSYESTSVLLDSMKGMYQNDMIIHTKQWGRSMDNWENACNIVRSYLHQRPDIVFNHIQDYFDLQDPVNVSIRVEPPGAGSLSFSGQKGRSGSIHGKYFPGMTYHVTAQSNPGFVFAEWDGLGDIGDSLEFELSDPVDLIARFLPSDQSSPFKVTEVYYNNKGAYDPGDWIEFYYFGIDTLALNGWYITGENDQVIYTFNHQSVIAPGEYFIITEDLIRFREVFPLSIQSVGDLNQSLSDPPKFRLRAGNGEPVQLFEPKPAGYWPQLPAEGYSLELKSIVGDIALETNWEISGTIFGSPGLSNHAVYNFQKPEGKDSIFSNLEQHLLPFYSTTDFYSDADHHHLAGISVKNIEGPGQFYANEERIESGHIYEPVDITFQPGELQYDGTILQYSFIDQSGQESSDYTIQFLNATGLNRDAADVFRIYPNPAQHICTIEITDNHMGPVDFYLFDLNGRVLKQLHSNQTERILTVDLTRVKSGIYFYMIKTSKSVRNGKLEVVN